MSIIHEALKKVQQSMSIPQPKSEQMLEVLRTSPPNNPNTSDKKTARRPVAPFLWIMGLMIVGGWGLYFSIPFWSRHLSLIKVNTQKLAHQSWQNLTTKVTSLLPKSQPLLQPANPAPAAGLDPFALQGVMADGSHSVALINGNIYQEGALVAGAKIIKIDLDAITIERNGKQEVVSVKK